MFQILPFLLFTAYLALTIFGVVMVVRFVTAQERISASLDRIADALRQQSTPPRNDNP